MSTTAEKPQRATTHDYSAALAGFVHSRTC